MAFSGISWAGLNTNDFEETVDFFSGVVGLRLIHRDEDGQAAHFRLSNGDMFEVFGPRHTDVAGRDQALTVAFEVDDLELVREAMRARGAGFVSPVETWKGHSWCYFQGPDGLVYEIKQTPRGG